MTKRRFVVFPSLSNISARAGAKLSERGQYSPIRTVSGMGMSLRMPEDGIGELLRSGEYLSVKCAHCDEVILVNAQGHAMERGDSDIVKNHPCFVSASQGPITVERIERGLAYRPSHIGDYIAPLH
jgi:hypothetical protein